MKLFLRSYDALPITAGGALVGLMLGLLSSTSIETIANPSYTVSLATAAPVLPVVLVGSFAAREARPLERLGVRRAWLYRVALVNLGFLACSALFSLGALAAGPITVGLGIRNFFGLFGLALITAGFGIYFQWIGPFAAVAVSFLAGVDNHGNLKEWAWPLAGAGAVSPLVIAIILYLAGNAVLIVREARQRFLPSASRWRARRELRR